KGASMGLLVSFAFVLAGAIGNIIDSAFYGMIFSESVRHGEIATLFPEGGGYSGFLRGKVVDMFYFEIARGYFPAWFPFWKGEEYIFFRPVFNIADTAITTGVLSIIVFYRRFFSEFEEERTITSPTEEEVTAESSTTETEAPTKPRASGEEEE
ncbi:MAG: signal peptidase II, partial [Bacteroidota bacterium]